MKQKLYIGNDGKTYREKRYLPDDNSIEFIEVGNETNNKWLSCYPAEKRSDGFKLVFSFEAEVS